MVRILNITLLLVIIPLSSAMAQEKAMGEEGAGAGAETCDEVLAKYLARRLGDVTASAEREKSLKPILEKCPDFTITSDAAETAIRLDEQRIDAELVRLGQRVGDSRSIVVFASETIDKDWISSFFTALPSSEKGEIALNECETALADEFSRRGFARRTQPLGKTERTQVRSFRTVVGRYRDMSAMPNFTSVRAAAMVDDAATAVVGCKVVIKTSGSENGYESCAAGRCKAVDMRSMQRVSMVALSKCASNADSTTANIAAIRDVCGEMGRSLSGDLLKKYWEQGGN